MNSSVITNMLLAAIICIAVIMYGSTGKTNELLGEQNELIAEQIALDHFTPPDHLKNRDTVDLILDAEREKQLNLEAASK